jgi:uncharacterized small protein (DUF1192 family)
MFTDDDLDPKTKRLKPRPLDKMSVPELKDYVESLKAEIVRAESDMAKKEKSKAAADALFGSRTGG